MRKFALLALAALALPACAQVFNMERNRVQIAPLTGLMRFHTGDDARWSEPDYDDSAWPLISSTSDWSVQGYKNYSGFAWYRFKVSVPQDGRQLGLFIPQILTSYQVFAEGKLVGSFGGFPPDATIDNIHQHLVLLPGDHGDEIEIAIRVWHWPQWARFYGGGLQQAPSIGDAGELKTRMMLENRSTFWELSAGNISLLINFLYGIAGLALFLMRRSEPLYFWYGICGIFFGSSELLHVCTSFYDSPQFAVAASTDMLGAAGFFSFVVFLWLMLGARRKLWVWIAFAALALHLVMWIVPASRYMSVSLSNAVFLAIDFPLFIGTLEILFDGVKRRDPDARLLLIPVLLNTLGNWINDGLLAALSLGNSWINHIWNFWNHTFSWPFPFGLYDLSIWFIQIAVVAILVLRFARSRQEEEQLKGELDAAEVVQKLLIPEEPPAVPGFLIESAYKPARHVGGDFFYIRPCESGALLVVVGDVSGKGLRAAMTVNSVIGALRTMPLQKPARILGDLNRGLVGQMQGGFVTCCAAHIEPDGKLIIANAGHLQPYLDGVEVEVSTGIPLGIVADEHYAESTLQLQPAARITLITDGVVEAQTTSGELFGFERAAAISHQPAPKIAEAAQEFGQEDDITVLTVAYAPA